MDHEWACMFIQTRNMADDCVDYFFIFIKLLATIFACCIFIGSTTFEYLITSALVYLLIMTIFCCFQKHIRVSQGTTPTGSQCSLDDAAYLAFRRKGTVLYTNEGTIYWSNPYEHAEEVFIRKTRNDIWWIDTIWIKNSPCRGCADKLIQHFDSKTNKPTLYIGKIWQGDKTANREGLDEMKAKGFHLKVWESKYNKDANSTRRYLENIDCWTMIITFLCNSLRNTCRLFRLLVVIMAAFLFLIIIATFLIITLVLFLIKIYHTYH